jgi:hypothetical protein
MAFVNHVGTHHAGSKFFQNQRNDWVRMLKDTHWYAFQFTGLAFWAWRYLRDVDRVIASVATKIQSITEERSKIA